MGTSNSSVNFHYLFAQVSEASNTARGGDLHAQEVDKESSVTPASGSVCRLELTKIQGEEEEGIFNDGFRTPKSMEHRICTNQRCPSAPKKKPRSVLVPLNLQIKEDAAGCCRRILSFTNEELESLFGMNPLISCGKIKKARRIDFC